MRVQRKFVEVRGVRGEDMLRGGGGMMDVQCRSGYVPERSDREGAGRA